MHDILNCFELPKSSKIGKKIFKKQFFENFSLKANEKKILKEDVESITLEYLLNSDNINIEPFVNDEVDFVAVAFISVVLSSDLRSEKVSKIIQNIPYPTVLLLFYKNKFCINLANKRVNKKDISKLLIVDEYVTSWIDLNTITDLENRFLDSLNIKNQPFGNFLLFYRGYFDKIIAFNASAFSGNLNINRDTKEILNDILHKEKRVTEIKNQIKKEINFSDRVNLSIELKKINDKLESLKSSL